MLNSGNKIKFLLIISIITLFSISTVCAAELNSTDTDTSEDDADKNILSQTDLDKVNEENTNEKTPKISVNSTNVNTGDLIEISMKNTDNKPLNNKNLIAIINNQKYNLFTNNNGAANLKLDLPSKTYRLDIIFNGDNEYLPFNKTFNIKVLKLNTKITPENTTVITGNYLYGHLTDISGNPINGANVTFTLNGKTNYYKTTNSKGNANLKINLNAKSYSIKMSFKGNDYYNVASKTFNLIVLAPTSIEIGNSILLTNGYLRIYLKCSNQKLISNRTVKITVNNKVYTKQTNSEGIIVFKPKANIGNIAIKVKFENIDYAAGSSSEKQVTGIKGDSKSPFEAKIPLKNGIPDIDYMVGTYVMGDENMAYTLTKNQYKEVIKRDSYCLYLNQKLSQYTFFKTKAEPNLKHIVIREKWNVIERAINTKIVSKNKNGYWPSQITVSLKGKSYTYPEVRDVQNTGYTCGPTSISMCSQVLRNYYCESYLAKLAGTTYADGSSTSGLKKALEKCNFKCTIYYKSSYSSALNELKKGGCALVFHTWNHYVAVLDISEDGKQVLMGNPSGDYNTGSHGIPTNWVSVSYLKTCFNNYDTSGLIVKLKYNLSKATKTKINYFYSSMGTNWQRQNTNDRIPQI